MKSLLFLSPLFLCCFALPVPAFARQPESDNRSKPSASEDSTESKENLKDKESLKEKEKSKEKAEEAERPIPEETQEERRARLRQNAIQGMGSPTSLLAIPGVLRELQLSERQIRDVQNHQKMSRIRLQLMYKGVRDLPRSEQSARMLELEPEADRFKAEGRVELLGFLTDEQRDRLWGISLQIRGSVALLDPEVAELLELTDEQIEQIMEIAEEMDRELRKLAQRFTSPEALRNVPAGPLKGQRGANEIRAEAEQKMLDVLTDAQREKYRERQGEKFHFQESKPPTPVDAPSESESEPEPEKSTVPRK